MKIREAQLSDLDDIFEFSRVLEASEKDLKSELTGSMALDNAWKAGLANEIINDDNLILLAEIGDEKIGFLSGGIGEKQSFWTYKKFADLDQLYIHPDYRNKGFAEQLSQYFFDWGKKQGADVVILSVLEENNIARDLYAKLGFNTHIIKLEKKL